MTDVVTNFKEARTPKRSKMATDRAQLGAVRAELGHRCQVTIPHECNAYLGVVLHHITRRGQGGGNEVGNLLPCCSNAHSWIHANPAAAREAGYIQ